MRADLLAAATAAAMLVAGLPVHAATEAGPAGEAGLLARMERLAARVEALEQRNAELERALASDRLSDKEPELATRVKSLESQAAQAQPAVKRMDALDGIGVEAGVVAVVQSASRGATDDGRRQTRASYRGDVEITLPAGQWDGVSGTALAALRFGQGAGAGLRPAFTGAVNSTAFEVGDGSDPDASFAILAQAYVQLDIPLPRDSADSQRHARVTLGKMDVFGFFDGNAIADDEASQFLDNVFVHNPLLDSGGDIAADAYGFAPGLVFEYVDETDAAASWTWSLGVFGAGNGANFSGSLRDPFVIAQAQTTRRWGLLPGSYRVYAWSSGQAEDYDGGRSRRRGVGLSIDQQLGEDLTVFGRWGHGSGGKRTFDRAITLGAQWTGNAWGRGGDALGLAWGRLRSSRDFAADSAGIDADADGVPDFGYAASGAESIVELYYRWDLGGGLQLTPDLQIIQRPGGDGKAADARVVGLRAAWAF
jgi:hypothetical protein